MEDLEQMIRKDENSPRILTIDIETSPIVSYTWGPKYESNIIEVLKDTNILSFSAKWLNGKQLTKGLNDYRGYKSNKVDDKKLVTDLREILDEADIVVTQNGIDFDMKLINARLLKHGLTPPSPYKNIDTKREAKKIVRLPSYSLDDMGAYFGIGHKLHHSGFDLWKRCMAGDINAWNKMKKYNAQDVILTEKLYLKLRPFMKTHPNVSVYTEKEECPKCHSDKVQKRGYTLTNASKYQRYQCQDCAGWYRGTKSIKIDNKSGLNI